MKNKLLIILLVILFIFSGFSIWKIFFSKTESYNQVVKQGGKNYNIEIYNPEDVFFIGIKALGLKVGISKPIVKKIGEAIKEIEGDVTSVGDCTGGACFDGTSDGGTYVDFYDAQGKRTDATDQF
jgi:hypothetical protein